jgi:hypothetical protein
MHTEAGPMEPSPAHESTALPYADVGIIQIPRTDADKQEVSTYVLMWPTGDDAQEPSAWKIELNIPDQVDYKNEVDPRFVPISYEKINELLQADPAQKIDGTAQHSVAMDYRGVGLELGSLITDGKPNERFAHLLMLTILFSDITTTPEGQEIWMNLRPTSQSNLINRVIRNTISPPEDSEQDKKKESSATQYDSANGEATAIPAYLIGFKKNVEEPRPTYVFEEIEQAVLLDLLSRRGQVRPTTVAEVQTSLVMVQRFIERFETIEGPALHVLSGPHLRELEVTGYVNPAIVPGQPNALGNGAKTLSISGKDKDRYILPPSNVHPRTPNNTLTEAIIAGRVGSGIRSDGPFGYDGINIIVRGRDQVLGLLLEVNEALGYAQTKDRDSPEEGRLANLLEAIYIQSQLVDIELALDNLPKHDNTRSLVEFLDRTAEKKLRDIWSLISAQGFDILGPSEELGRLIKAIKGYTDEDTIASKVFGIQPEDVFVHALTTKWQENLGQAALTS